MDTSKEYILMCEKAEEIQKQWKPKEWDCVYNQDDVFGYIDRSEIHIWCILPESIADSGHYGPYVDDGKICDERYKDCIWLPRQDQLQEIGLDCFPYWKSDHKSLNLIQNFHEWYEEDSGMHEGSHDLSMEQLWLCYVMEEKYNKRWNGKEWELW